MDALTALRVAIMEGRADRIKLADGNITIDDVSYPALSDTAFRASGAQSRRTYKLLALWLMYVVKDKPFAEYMKACNDCKLPMAEFVMITDKKDVVDYLTGVSAALGRIEPSRVGASAASSARPAGSTGADKESELVEDTLTWDMALRRETACHTLESVLLVPGKNLMSTVFPMLREHAILMGEDAPIVLAAPSTGATAGSKRSRSGAPAGGSISNGMEGFAGSPYIVVPASATSLINMYNAEAFFRDNKFIPAMDARAAATTAKPERITITRRNARGVECRFHIIDNVALFRNRADWSKVVAVFAQGPEWQFKGWRWGRTPDRPDITPPEIFDRCLGFAMLYEGDTPHPNIPKWAVTLLPVSKTRRYLDAGLAAKFWSAVDTQIELKQPHLLPKGSVPIASTMPLA